MSEPVGAYIALSVISRIKISLEDGLENAQELLADHETKLGRTTRKNEAVAKMYDAQISEFKQLIAALSDL